VITVAIGANESLVIVDIQAALDSAFAELLGGDIMCRVTLATERPNLIGRKHFVGRGPVVLIVTVRVRFTVTMGAGDVCCGVGTDYRLFGIIGVTDEARGVFGGGRRGCGSGHILSVARFGQEQRGISINNQRRKAAHPAGLQIVVGGNLELLGLSLTRATTTEEQPRRTHGKNGQHDADTSFYLHFSGFNSETVG